jgi:uncharacterized membrane protein
MEERMILMDKRIYIILIAIMSLIILGTISSSAASKHSTTSRVNIDLYLLEDGTLHVKQNISCDSDSIFFSSVFKEIPVTGHQKLQNLRVFAEGTSYRNHLYSDFNVSDGEGVKKVDIYLFSDPQKTIPFGSSTDVNVILEYDLLNAVNIYNDTAEFSYKLGYEGGMEDYREYNVLIHLKSSDNVQYWVNPPYYVDRSKWYGNDLQIISKRIPSSSRFYIRMTIPRNQFVASPVNGYIINQNALSQIVATENSNQNNDFKTNVYTIMAVLILLGSFLPILIYFKYGREPKIDYNAEYERDLPTDDPPAIVNAICNKSSKKVGYPDMDGFKATIMDLINRNYFILVKPSFDGEDVDSEYSIFLEVNQDRDINDLWDFELDIISFLQEYEEDGIISMERVSESFSYINNVEFFNETYKNWIKDVRKALTKGNMEQAFLSKGDRYFKMFGVAGLSIAIVLVYSTIQMLDPVPALGYVRIASVILGIAAVISIIIPDKIGGRWTSYGMEYNLKWKNFKKFVEDFSLIKEYPPESIVIWNRYLVYATALGAADGVKKAMEITLPKSVLSGSDLYMYHYFSPTSLLNEAIKTAKGSD